MAFYGQPPQPAAAHVPEGAAFAGASAPHGAQGVLVPGGYDGAHMHGAPAAAPQAGAGAGGTFANCYNGGCSSATTGCYGGNDGSGVMSFVGDGRGAYTAETTYKYVGQGGEFSFVNPKRSPIWAFLVGGLVTLASGVALFAVLMPDATTTTPKPVGGEKSCLLWGDPHVETFDGAFPNFYDEGEFWIVKTHSPTDAVWMQGRYLATKYTKGLAATHTIAIGGPFLQGNKLTVGPMNDGMIAWNDAEIMPDLDSDFKVDGLLSATYNSEGRVVDPANSDVTKHIVHIDLPQGIHVQIMRWEDYVNARITMVPRAEGQDGSCGNFNGDTNDDTEEFIGRAAGRVSVDELLFHSHADVNNPGTHRTIADCAPEKRDAARATCNQAQPQARGVLLEDCMFDVCFGGEEFAAADAVAESEA